MTIDKKKIEIYKNLILDIKGVEKVEFDRSVESSVTTSWGVSWNSDYIARDILQNFRDANKDKIDTIKVETKNDKIIVNAKSCFDLRKLFFVGSNKAGDDEAIGEYGEGFKAAIVSLLTDKSVKSLLGMTGEISLRGNVLPIGGLKEKSTAAHRAGLNHIIAPFLNEKDLEEIPSQVQKDLKITFVKDVEDVIKLALEN